MLNNIVESSTFVAYETNINDISNLITGYTEMKYNGTNDTCFFKKDNNENLMLLCLIPNEGIYSLGKITEKIIFKNIKYNIILENIENSEAVTSLENGSHIITHNPYTLDFSLMNEIIIEFTMKNPENSKGLRLIQDSKENLDCEDLTFIKRCTINKNYFKGKKSDFYYLYHLNHLNELSRFYELSPFEVILPSDTIVIRIKDEDNQFTNEIGSKGTIEIITDFNDDENIFKVLDINQFTFTNKLMDENNNIYDAVCNLWKPNSGKIKLFCKFNANLPNQNQIIIFPDIDTSFKSYSVKIISKNIKL